MSPPIVQSIYQETNVSLLVNLNTNKDELLKPFVDVAKKMVAKKRRQKCQILTNLFAGPKSGGTTSFVEFSANILMGQSKSPQNMRPKGHETLNSQLGQKSTYGPVKYQISFEYNGQKVFQFILVDCPSLSSYGDTQNQDTSTIVKSFCSLPRINKLVYVSNPVINPSDTSVRKSLGELFSIVPKNASKCVAVVVTNCSSDKTAQRTTNNIGDIVPDIKGKPSLNLENLWCDHPNNKYEKGNVSIPSGMDAESKKIASFFFSQIKVPEDDDDEEEEDDDDDEEEEKEEDGESFDPKELDDGYSDRNDLVLKIVTLGVVEEEILGDVKGLNGLIVDKMPTVVKKGESVKKQLDDAKYLVPGQGHYSTICCACMKNSHCTVCTSKCSYHHHVHARYTEGDPIWKCAEDVKNEINQIKELATGMEKKVNQHLARYNKRTGEYHILNSSFKSTSMFGNIESLIQSSLLDTKEKLKFSNQPDETKRLQSLLSDLQSKSLSLDRMKTGYYQNQTKDATTRCNIGLATLSSSMKGPSVLNRFNTS
ncbi:hypothetical protein DFA_04783 [Cavenderia fasciculata]|uniref:Uncharacterized protein n=1 Tax=Cavenderia fasciculata TaxID=261658 RepID=F4PQJ0_CACFS|nr:uncharacterized protein DFA_04783 [Cavenderia fasciculata]EGG22653.1 hypothetical protein DFA_04783 [Cavenderia fasciculata]|eukprot:XP_004360504.1 hypothetical protein DFA_04783 [Cavenderia fasciculata]